jgi:hypothetical protein
MSRHGSCPQGACCRPSLELLEPRFLLSVSADVCGFDGDILASGEATPEGESYLLVEEWGGTWTDTEKSPDTNEDDLLCWAAAGSNVLEWTGWGLVEGIASADEAFAYIQDHWSNFGGEAELAWDWWFDGVNDHQGDSGWAQVEVPGGGFFPEMTFADYFHKESSTLLAMPAVDAFLRDGCGVVLSLRGMGGHAITCWGFQHDPAESDGYLGVWVTDSDDDKDSSEPPDALRYYEVDYRNGRWHLVDYSDSNLWYIHEVTSLARVGDALDNHPPELTDPTVTPLLATGAESCEFRVHYRDPDGDAPTDGGAICLLTGGIELEMSLVSGAPADGVYARQITLPPGGYQHLFRFVDARGLDTVLPWRPGPYVDLLTGDDLSIDAIVWDDTFGGDNDSAPEPGEVLDLRVQLASAAAQELTDVVATLSLSAGEASILQSSGSYGSVDGAEAAWAGQPFRVQAQGTGVEDAEFALDVTYLRDGARYYQRLSFAQSFAWCWPDIQVQSVVVHDPGPGGDGDGLAQSGEYVELDLYLKNLGTSVARDLKARLTDLSFGGDDSAWLSYGELSPGESAICQQAGRFTLGDALGLDLLGTVTGTVETLTRGTSLILEEDRPLFEVHPAGWVVVEPGEWDFGVRGTQDGVLREISVHNPGTADLKVSDVAPSHWDTTWSGDPLPWIIPPGGTRALNATIDTSDLRGLIAREIVLATDGRIMLSPTSSDRVTITGTITDAPPAYAVPGTDAGCGAPDVSGSRIVYLRGSAVHLYDFQTGDSLVVVPEDGAPRRHTRISGDLIAWEQDGEQSSDVYACDLSSLTPYPVADTDADERLLGVDGDLVAYVASDFAYPYWSDEFPGRNVYCYDTDNASTIRISDYELPEDSSAVLSASPAGDFGDGVLTWHRESHGWLGPVIGWSDAFRVGVEKFVLSVDAAPVFLADHVGDSPPAAASGKVFWCKEDATSPHDEQIWVWENGASRRVTTEADDPYTDHLGPVAGEGFVVHAKNGTEELFWTTIDSDTRGPATQRAAQEPRADGRCLVWADEGIHCAFLLQPDLCISPADVAFEEIQLQQHQVTQAAITVHNVSPWDAEGDVTIELEGVDVSGQPVSWIQTVISGGIRPRDEVSVAVNVTVPHDWMGPCEVQARVHLPEGDYESNNTATRLLEVLDSDTSGPEILNLVVEESDGDDDGVIGSDERVRIAWELSDPSGIGDAWLFVDGEPIDPGISLDVVLPPLSPGVHPFRIEAEDADPWDPTVTTLEGAFEVVAAEEISVLYDGTPLEHEVSLVDLGDFEQGVSGVQKVLILRNDGRQSLALGTVTVPEGFGVVAPASSLLSEGASTHMTLTLDTSTPGIHAGTVRIPSSDSDEDPFRFEVIARVLPAVPGDGNADGAVTDADYTIWADHYGQQGADGPLIGDFDVDGHVTDADYTIWADSYGETGSGTQSLTRMALP